MSVSSDQKWRFFNHPRCPTEIRDLIWQQAIAAEPARILEVIGGISDPFYTLDMKIFAVDMSIISRAPVPALLHACSRSRKLAMERWTLTLHSKYKYLTNNVTTARDMRDPTVASISKVWFDSESDTLLFRNHVSTRYLDISIDKSLRDVGPDARQRVRNVAVNVVQTSPGIVMSRNSAESQIAREMEKRLPAVRKVSVAFQSLRPEDMHANSVTALRFVASGSYWEECSLDVFRRMFFERRGEGMVVIEMVELITLE